MKHLSLSLGMAATLAISTSQLYADESYDELALLYGDEESVTIATGSDKPLHLAPSVASVITAEQIKAMGATTLDHVLERVPGLHVAYSFNRLNSIWSIRGIHADTNPQVLFMVNGMRITDGTTGSRPPSFSMPVENIARVEVVRGPGSAIYGADAFAGVVNVITKGYEGYNGLTLGARTDTIDSRETWIQTGKQLGDWNAAFSLEWQQRDGDSSRVVDADLQTFLDTTFALVPPASNAPGTLDTTSDVINTSLNLSNGGLKLGFWGWLQRDGGVGPGVAGALDNTGYTEVDSYAFDIEYGKTLGDNFEYHARYAFQYQDQFTHFELFPPGAAMPIGADGNIDFATPVGMVSFPDGIIGNPGGEERRHLLDLDFIYTGLTNHRFRFGVGASDVSIETDETKNFGPGIIDGTQPVVDGTLTDVTDTAYVFMPDTNRQLWYLLAQDEWQLANDWALTAGVRYDHYSDFGSTTNPRLALVWATSYNLTSKLLYGRAFRAPAFSETQYINNPSILGNSDLDPETIDTLELAFDYRPSFNSRMAINFYAYNSEDLIDTVADVGTGTSTYQNTETQTGHGLELELDWQPTARVSLDLNYAWQHSEDENGDEIPDAPGQQISAAAQWQFIDAATLRMQTNWVGDRQRNPADTRSDIDDYLLTDLSLRIAPASMPFELALTGYNIFDEDAREPSSDALATPGDYPLEEQRVMAELRLHLDRL